MVLTGWRNPNGRGRTTGFPESGSPASGVLFGQPSSPTLGMGQPHGSGPLAGEQAAKAAGHGDTLEPAGSDGGVGDSIQPGLEGHSRHGGVRDQPRWLAPATVGSASASGSTDFWSDYYIIPCADGKSRRVKRGIECLVAGVPGRVVPSGDPGVEEAQATTEARVMRLRGYGNSINPYVAAEFIRAFMDVAGISPIHTGIPG